MDNIKIKYHSNVWIIATCSSALKLPPKFLCRYRFGQPIEIPLPSMQSRYEIARRCLMERLSADDWIYLCPDTGFATHTLISITSWLEYEFGISHLASTISRGSKVSPPLAQIEKPIGIHRYESAFSNRFSSGNAEGTFILEPFDRWDMNYPVRNSLVDQLCTNILANSQSLISVDFNLQNYFCDFSLASMISPPQPVFGFEDIVDDLIMKCLPWRFAQKHSHLKCHIKPCRGSSSLLSVINQWIGVLLYGPTGCGKTAIATRIAYETKNEFKFLSISCAELIHKVFLSLIYLVIVFRSSENLKSDFRDCLRQVSLNSSILLIFDSSVNGTLFSSPRQCWSCPWDNSESTSNGKTDTKKGGTSNFASSYRSHFKYFADGNGWN